MEQVEDIRAQAVRHLQLSEERVARLAVLLEELAADGHEQAADTARGVLATLRASIQSAREQLRAEEIRVI